MSIEKLTYLINKNHGGSYTQKDMNKIVLETSKRTGFESNDILEAMTNYYTIYKDNLCDINSILLNINKSSWTDISIKDYMRFNFNVWPFPDSTLDTEDKYFQQVYIILSPHHLQSFNTLLIMGTTYSWNIKKLKQNLYDNLREHTQLLKNNDELSKLASSHTGSALSISTKNGAQFNKYLSNISIIHELTIFRTLNTDYLPVLHIGDVSTTKDIWSTSYDPISSIAFGISEDSINNIYVIRARLPDNFKGGLLVENNFKPDVIKEQHEFTLAAGIQFKVINIFETRLEIPDDGLETRRVKAKIYDIIMT